MRRLPIFCVLLLALAGCDTEAPVADANGDVSFLLNGEEWAVSARAGATAADFGYLIVASWPSPANPSIRQQLTILLPDLVERTYPAARQEGDEEPYGLSISERDDDATLSRHLAVDAASETGGFTVTRYDPATGDIEATFEGTFGYRGGNESIRTLPDTFRVTNGRLRVRLAN